MAKLGLLLIPILFLLNCKPLGKESITTDELYYHVKELASDHYQGRDIGKQGIYEAEEYIARRFKEIGLSPLQGKDYFLEFNLYAYGFDEKRTTLTLNIQGETHEYTISNHYKPFPFSGTGQIRSDIVFAGYGITAPEYNYDDYQGLDVKGKLVFLLRHEPNQYDSQSPFQGTYYSSHSFFKSKLKNAENHGAIGMLIVTDPLFEGEADDLRPFEFYDLSPELEEKDIPNFRKSTSFPALHISKDVAATILSPSGQNLEQLQQEIDAGKIPAEINIGTIQALVNIFKRDKPVAVASRNVAAIIQGSDPLLKDEWIVICAHHDHLGSFTGEGDTIFNGADDNASGVSAVLELAEAFATYFPKPARSLLFVTFSAEEKGLLGAKALLEDEVIDVAKIKYVINLDMVGRNSNKKLLIIYQNASDQIIAMIKDLENFKDLPMRLTPPLDERYLSDDHVFAQQGITTFFFFNGDHEDYHTVRDHTEKLHYRTMYKITNLAFEIILMLSNLEE